MSPRAVDGRRSRLRQATAASDTRRLAQTTAHCATVCDRRRWLRTVTANRTYIKSFSKFLRRI